MWLFRSRRSDTVSDSDTPTVTDFARQRDTSPPALRAYAVHLGTLSRDAASQDEVVDFVLHTASQDVAAQEAVVGTLAEHAPQSWSLFLSFGNALVAGGRDEEALTAY